MIPLMAKNGQEENQLGLSGKKYFGMWGVGGVRRCSLIGSEKGWDRKYGDAVSRPPLDFT